MIRRLNPWLIGYFLVYALNFVVISQIPGFPADETLGIFLVVGLGFSLLAWLSSKNAKPLVSEKPVEPLEPVALLLLVSFLTIAIVLGNRPVTALLPASWCDEETEKSIITLVRKVLTFFVIPFLVYNRFFQFRLQDFGLSFEWKKVFSRKALLIFLVMSAAVLFLNYFGGSGARPIREGQFETSQLLVAFPLLFAWGFIEVGLVEEFFFRGLLQNRITALLRSNWAGICIASFIFGLVHAPGMYLRGAGAIEGLGGAPSLLACIGYCIAVQSAAGFFFAIIWSRTRNLWLVMAIHSMTDLLPHASAFIRNWEL